MVHQVIYNRKRKQWDVHNGHELGESRSAVLVVVSFPTKQAAQLYALEVDCPAVHKEVCAIIDATRLTAEANAIEKRAVKAGLLVRDGHILPANSYWGDQLNAYCVVKSQSDPGRIYHIFPGWSDLSCTCEDFAWRAPWFNTDQRVCKHILAYLIALAVQEPHEEIADLVGRKIEDFRELETEI